MSLFNLLGYNRSLNWPRALSCRRNYCKNKLLLEQLLTNEIARDNAKTEHKIGLILLGYQNLLEMMTQ